MLLAAGLAAFVWSSPIAAGQNAVAVSAYERAFAAYAHGDYDVLTRTLRTEADLMAMFPEAYARKVIEYPINLTTPWQRSRALFHVELALTAIDRKWVFAIEAVTSAAASYLVRRFDAPGAKPDDDAFERDCHSLMLAAFQGAIAPDLIEWYVDQWIARKKRPGDPRYALALAIAQEQKLLPTTLVRLGLAKEPTFMLPDARAARRLSQAAIARFDTARQDPATRTEASVRTGVVWFRRNEPEAALPYLRAVDTSAADPTLRYWAKLFEGRALEALGRGDAAGRAYEEAAQTSPGAQSASMAIAALHFLAGRREDAAAIVRSTLDRTPPPDPWLTYWFGEARFLPAWLAAARGALR